MLIACSHVSSVHAARLFEELKVVYPRLPDELQRLSLPLVSQAPGVSLGELERLLMSVSRWSGDQALGLTLGSREQSALYPGRASMLAAPSVRAALQVLQQVPSPLDGGEYALRTRGQRATLSCRSEHDLPWLGRFHAEYMLSQVLCVLRALHPGRTIAVQRMCFRHPAPPLRARYAAFFRGPVRFEQEEDSLTFASELLDLAVTCRSTGLDEASRAPARLPRAPANASLLSEQVRRQLRGLPSLVGVDSVELARALGLSQRALRRRLAAEGTSMSVLLDEERSRLACEQLALGVCLDTIVQRIGFASGPNFERAFRRWSGLSPKQYAWRLAGAAAFKMPARPGSRPEVLPGHAGLRIPWEFDQSSA
jgi:AraC-like DNA-binding protein